MKKILILVLFFMGSAVFALDEKIEMAAMFPPSNLVYPANDDFENITDIQGDEELKSFSSQLSLEFDIQWCNDNFDKDSRVALSSVASPILSQLLPCENVLFSKPMLMDSGEKSFRIKNMDNGNVYSVILKNGKIISISKI